MIAGVGCDLVECARLARALERTPRLAARLFTAAEREAAGGRVERLAGLFAAKEAVMKALGTGLRGGSWVEVEVGHDAQGRPLLQLHGSFAAVAAAQGVRALHLSLSHTAGLAMAQVVAET
ncbi:MAG TPA: holo-ACP synthase [Bacillota bacterium]|nr:holo-ACP synthase [Bacillota bacterium]